MTMGKITGNTGIDYCSSVSRYVRKSYFYSSYKANLPT